MKLHRYLLPLAAMLFVTSMFASADSARGAFTRTISVSDMVDLDISTGSGNVTVTSGNSGTVSISARINARGSEGMSADEKVRIIEANPPIAQSGNTIRIGQFDRRELRQNVSISYELVVPERTQLVARTGSGNEKIHGIAGPVKVESGSGTLSLTNIGGEVKATTGSGDIHLDQIQGPVRVNTGSGGIRAEGVSGEFTASTGSGDVTMRQNSSGPVRVGTGSGTIVLEGVNGELRADTGSGDINAQGTVSRPWRLHTGSGGVHLQLPSSLGYDLDARTDSGSIHVQQPITRQGSISKSHVQGKVLGGGALLELETGSGDIRID